MSTLFKDSSSGPHLGGHLSRAAGGGGEYRMHHHDPTAATRGPFWGPGREAEACQALLPCVRRSAAADLEEQTEGRASGTSTVGAGCAGEGRICLGLCAPRSVPIESKVRGWKGLEIHCPPPQPQSQPWAGRCGRGVIRTRSVIGTRLGEILRWLAAPPCPSCIISRQPEELSSLGGAGSPHGQRQHFGPELP